MIDDAILRLTIAMMSVEGVVVTTSEVATKTFFELNKH